MESRESKELVQAPSAYELMERADEQMVLDEIKGRAMDALVYEFRQDGQTITGLSLCGVRETARLMNANGKARIGISDREPLITETEDYYEVKVYAQDLLNGGGYWGLKRQPKRFGNGRPNPFALEQALAKAQRNALRGLIPEWFTKEMIAAFRAQRAVKALDAGGSGRGETAEASPKDATATATPAKAAPDWGKTPKVKIGFREFPTWAEGLAQRVPYYARSGKPDTWHILAAVEKLGYHEVNTGNVSEVEAALIDYAKANEVPTT